MAEGRFIFGQVRRDARGRIDESVPCRYCGRDLDGELSHANCPGCGKPIADSIHEELLRFQSPAWLNRLTIGLVVVMLGVLLDMVIGGFRVALFADWLPDITYINLVVWDLITVAPLMVAAGGVWLVASRQPMDFAPEPPLSIRRAAQWAAGCAAALAGLYVLTDALLSNWGAIPGLRLRMKLPWLMMIHGIWIGVAWAGLQVGARIALRSPDVRLGRWLGLASWMAAGALGLVYIEADLRPVLGQSLRLSGTLADEGVLDIYRAIKAVMIAVNALAAPVALWCVVLMAMLLVRVRQAAGRYAGNR